MPRITATEAALIQRHIISNAALVARCERGLNRLAALALTDPELATLNARLRELTATTAALDLSPVQVAA